MASEDIFEEWNVYADRKELMQRQIDLDFIEKSSKLKIIPITGIRRAGKSSILILLKQKLNKEGKKAAYINIEDSRLKGNKNLLDDILKWFSDSGFLLLDEITNANDWEGWLARNHEMLKGKLNLIVSSSRKSLAMPNKPLRGRMLPQEVYPLSFKEFLEFKNIKVEKTTIGIGKIEKALEEYIIYGGFPEAVLLEGYLEKINLINSYFKDIIGLDVAELSKEDISAVETFGRYVIESPYFSASKCLNYFKTLGYKIGKQSILQLEKYSQLGYLFFFVQIFSRSMKARGQYPRKAYLGDAGLMAAISGKQDKGRLYENAVFLELKRKLRQNQEINYWKNLEGNETDFVIREGLHVKEIIQVVYELDKQEIKNREVKGIVACAGEFGLKKGLIITKDFESKEVVKGITLNFIPLWKWMMDE